MVRFGFTPAFMRMRAASRVVAHPVPLSVVPVAPSHESMWPPTITYSSGLSVPGMSARTLYSLIGPFLKKLRMSNSRVTGLPALSQATISSYCFRRTVTVGTLGSLSQEIL